MKTELKINDANADSVIQIVQQSFTNARAIKTGPMKEEEKKPALHAARKEEMARLRSHLIKSKCKNYNSLCRNSDRKDKAEKLPTAPTSSLILIYLLY